MRQRLKNTKYYPKDDEEMTERVKKGTLKKGEVVNPIAPNEAPSLVINGACSPASTTSTHLHHLHPSHLSPPPLSPPPTLLQASSSSRRK